jgi:hypothetical protein
LGAPPSRRSHIGSPVSTFSATTRWSLTGTYTRSAKIAGCACAGDPRSRRQITWPSLDRIAVIDPLVVASRSHPPCHVAGTASVSAAVVFQATEPSAPLSAVNMCPCTKKIESPPAAGALVTAASTIHCRVPDPRS